MDEQRGSGTAPRRGGVAVYGVSDEVWRAIEPEARAAASRERRVLSRAALAVALLLVVAVGVVWSGAFAPRLSGGDNSGYGTGTPGERAHLSFDLHNDGVLTEHVTGWAVDVPGVHVLDVAPAPLDVAPRSKETVTIQLRVADCARATRVARAARASDPVDGIGVRVSTSRPWGTASTTVTPPGSVADLLLMACGVDLSEE